MPAQCKHLLKELQIVRVT